VNAQDLTKALASASFRYALRRIAVFPLAPGTKIPIKGSHGCRDATSDSDVARARWQRTPQANIAAATGARSGFVVVDVDVPHGPESLAVLEAEHGPLSLTIEASTPSDGRHLYFRHVEGIRNSVGRIGRGLDIRGEGGQIVLPPSVLADGGRYRWIKNGARAFADAPEWLINLARPPAPTPRAEPKPPPADIENYVASAVVSELKELSAAQDGTRNDALNRAAFNLAQFVKAGALPEDWARGQLEAHAVAAGLSVTEARRTIQSAFGAAQPRSLPL
jgi:hypothetical protein